MVYECPECHGLAGNHRGHCSDYQYRVLEAMRQAIVVKPKWVHFEALPQKAGTKTMIWAVLATKDNTKLGEIRWFGRWRKYTFQPAPDTVYEEDCLRDIADFCEKMTTARNG